MRVLTQSALAVVIGLALAGCQPESPRETAEDVAKAQREAAEDVREVRQDAAERTSDARADLEDRKSTRLNSSH